MAQMVEEKVMNIEEAANFIGVCQSTVRKYVRAGVIRHHRLGGRLKFLVTELVEDVKNADGGEEGE